MSISLFGCNFTIIKKLMYSRAHLVISEVVSKKELEMIFVGVCSKFAKLFFVAKLKGLRAFSSNICEIEIK